MKFNRFWRYRSVLLSLRFADALRRSRKNILSAEFGRPLRGGPFMAELDVTYRCDCRCRMCQRWKDPRRNELTVAEYERLSEAFDAMGVYLISIAGGEPLLRKDIFSVIESFTRRGMFVNLCTNGTLLEETIGRLRQTGLSCITVSLDGATGQTHDTLRRTPGAYEKIHRGLKRLLDPGRERLPMVRVRMTVSDRNVDEIGRYYRMWSKTADDVLLQPIHYSAGAFYTGRDAGVFRIDPRKLARQLDAAPLRRNGYMKRLVACLAENRGYPRHRCYAGVLMVRLDPWGNVFPCLEQRVRVGSVRENDFQEIWRSAHFDEVRRQIAEDADCGCWYNNTALMSHYGALLGCTSARKLCRVISGRWTRTVGSPDKA